MSFERYLSVQIKQWRKTIFTPKKAIIVAITIWILLFCFNASLFFTIQFDSDRNVSIRVACYTSPFYIEWLDVSNFKY